MTTRIKVCCIASPEEAQAAIAAGVHAVGLVGKMPSGPGVISDEAIAEIAGTIPPGVDSFLLTSETDPDAVVEHVRACDTSVVQLVASVPHETYAALREHCRGTRIVQVIHVEGPELLASAQAVAPLVDAVLLDSGSPQAATPALGGTGKTHDWNVSRQIVAALDVPVFLAGGLSPANVEQAIRQVAPFGVDVCSRLRQGPDLDDALLAAFVQGVHDADEAR